jgi:succinate dehydrogenase / fumarate reductase iron-sulfur subunit
MKMSLKIRRSNPMDVARRGPWVEEYGIEAEEGMTVLDALLKIADEDDPTLSFRRSCRSAICGSCAVNINGSPGLACSTQLMDAGPGEVLIEPLANHTPLKDLMVDLTPFWKKMDKAAPFLTPAEAGTPARVSKEDALAIDSSQSCIMCACCNSACSSLEGDPGFIGPAALVKAWRFVGDVREGHSGRRLDRLSAEHGMWDCVRCVQCAERCPKGVDPLRQIERLRSRAIEEGLLDNPGARHVEAMADSIRRVGRLDEAAMTFKTLGFLRSLGMIPLGIKMEMRGKLPYPLIFTQIDGIDEVRRIFDAFEGKRGGKGAK